MHVDYQQQLEQAIAQVKSNWRSLHRKKIAAPSGHTNFVGDRKVS